jgi:Zn-dependent alcohol dehydrogenase
VSTPFRARGRAGRPRQGARARGAASVLAIDPSAERREWARRFGATDVLDADDEDAIAALRRGAPREGFDWTIVTVGQGAALALGVELLRPGGTAAMVGLAPQDQPVAIDMLELVTYERRVVGSAYGTLSPPLLVARILDLYRGGALKLDELVADRFPLERINDAFDTTRSARGLRSLLHFDG